MSSASKKIALFLCRFLKDWRLDGRCGNEYNRRKRCALSVLWGSAGGLRGHRAGKPDPFCREGARLKQSAGFLSAAPEAACRCCWITDICVWLRTKQFPADLPDSEMLFTGKERGCSLRLHRVPVPFFSCLCRGPEAGCRGTGAFLRDRSPGIQLLAVGCGKRYRRLRATGVLLPFSGLLREMLTFGLTHCTLPAFASECVRDIRARQTEQNLCVQICRGDFSALHGFAGCVRNQPAGAQTVADPLCDNERSCTHNSTVLRKNQAVSGRFGDSHNLHI